MLVDLRWQPTNDDSIPGASKCLSANHLRGTPLLKHTRNVEFFLNVGGFGCHGVSLVFFCVCVFYLGEKISINWLARQSLNLYTGQKLERYTSHFTNQLANPSLDSCFYTIPLFLENGFGCVCKE